MKNKSQLAIYIGVLFITCAVVFYRISDAPRVSPVIYRPGHDQRIDISAQHSIVPMEVRGEVGQAVGISGRVIGEGRRPLSGVIVRARWATFMGELLSTVTSSNGDYENLGYTDGIMTGVSDEEGRFSLGVVQTGIDYRVDASAIGYVSTCKTVFVPEQGLDNLLLVLIECASVDGMVVDLEGKAVPYVIVGALNQDKLWKYLESSASTTVDGAFHISGIEPGTYHLSARYVPPERPKRFSQGLLVSESIADPGAPLAIIDLTEGQHVGNLKLVLPWRRQSAVGGVVCDELGTPIAGASVWATYHGAIVQFADGHSDDRGRFRISNLPSMENVELRATHEGYEECHLAPVAIGSDDNVLELLTLRRGSLVVTVLDAGKRAPITDARVLLNHVATDWGRELHTPDLLRQARVGAGKVDVHGQCHLRDIQAGRAGVLVFSPTHGMARIDGIQVLADQESEFICLLAAQAKLTVTIFPEGMLRGRQADDFHLSCTPEGETFVSQGSWQMTPELYRAFQGQPKEGPRAVELGSYEFALQPGLYEVKLSYRVFYPENPSIVSSQNTLVNLVEIQAGSTHNLDLHVGTSNFIEGYVHPTGLQSGSYVVLTPRSEMPILEGLPIDAEDFSPYNCTHQVHVSELNPFYIITCVPPGKYSISLVATESDGTFRRCASEPIELGPDECITVDFL